MKYAKKFSECGQEAPRVTMELLDQRASAHMGEEKRFLEKANLGFQETEKLPQS